MQKIGLVTCEKHPNGIPSEINLPSEFKEKGINAEFVVWSDASIDWKSYDNLIIRSTWDYYTREAEFRAWLKKIIELGVPLFNPPVVIFDNMHKFYLREFANAGIKIIPTIFSDEKDVIEKIEAMLWNKIVIKPAVSAGSYLTEVFEFRPENHLSILNKIKPGDWLIQPFLNEIEEGEISMIFFNKKFSHSIKKKPAEGDFRIQRQFGGQYQAYFPNEELLKIAANIVNHVTETLLYARVDGLMINNEFHLMELEMIEPDLYFEFSEEYLNRYIEAYLEILK
jgi:glutathione synthase/RimK-type ligase-like ATP-grasp enzyme